MKKNMPIYALAAAIVVVGLVLAGLPAAALLPILLAGGCALTMFFMMRGMDGTGGGDPHDSGNDTRHSTGRHPDAPGRVTDFVGGRESRHREF
jgi:hypothetical protein